MRAEEFIKETNTIMEVPLPQDWDKQVYTPQTSYKKRIEYAVKRAQQSGTGSSRTAFMIEYQGRQTILKVAKNRKGMGQNEAEANILEDYILQQLDIAIPLIDYDEEHDQPVWIHMEKAQKATGKQLCAMMKCPSLDILIDHASYIASGQNASKLQEWLRTKLSAEDLETFFEYSDKLSDLSNNWNINISDFRRPANWGIWNNTPRVIDLGFTQDVAKDYYGFR
jgi:hypothetical protein